MSFRRFLRSNSGATAVEFSLVVGPLLALCIGIVEVGRTLSVQSDIIHAAEKAQRAIMLNGLHSGQELPDILAVIDPIIRDTFKVGYSEKLTIAIKEKNIAGERFKELTVNYPVGALIPFVGNVLPEVSVTRLIPSE